MSGKRLLSIGNKAAGFSGTPEFKVAPFSALKCEDSMIEGETTVNMGKALGIKITNIAFGKLPTPKLGEGCTTCTEGVHPPPSVSASIEMLNGNDYVLKSSEAFELLSCFGLGVTCLYGSARLVSLVDSDVGKHKEAAEEKGLAQILVSGTLFFIKGSNFCPEEGSGRRTTLCMAWNRKVKPFRAGSLYTRPYKARTIKGS